MGRPLVRVPGRWRRWWRAAVAGSRFWQALTGHVATPVDPARLPASLLERFGGDIQAQLLATWRVLLPITGGEVFLVNIRPPVKSTTYGPLEFRAEEGETPRPW